MKTTILSIAAALVAFTHPASAVEPPKASVTLSVKKQLIDSDHDLRGRQGSVRKRVFTLRVEIENTGSSTIDGATLSGTALVMRAAELKETLNKENLGPINIPSMAPGAKQTLDLGRISLGEVEQRNHKAEETLEEWQVNCSQGGIEIGKAVSSDRFESLSKKVPQPAKKKVRRKKKTSAP